MHDATDIKKVTNYCVEKLDFEGQDEGFDNYYSSMPLCVVDSVFSIGVRYEGVVNTVERLCAHFKIPVGAKRKGAIPSIKDQISTTRFLELFGNKTPKFLAENIYQNKQRTSTSNGILKAEAVLRFLKVLREFKVEYYQDILKIIKSEDFEMKIKEIPGQRSGISLKYFFMLSGTDDMIKPDRMVIRFLQKATMKIFNLDECQTVLAKVTKELNRKGYELTPKLLDNLIWMYQRING